MWHAHQPVTFKTNRTTAMAAQLFGVLTCAPAMLQAASASQAKHLLLMGNNVQLCAFTAQHRLLLSKPACCILDVVQHMQLLSSRIAVCFARPLVYIMHCSLSPEIYSASYNALNKKVTDEKNISSLYFFLTHNICAQMHFCCSFVR